MQLSFLPPFAMGSNFQRKNLLLEEQILSCKSNAHFGRAASRSQANRKSKQSSFFVIVVEIEECVPVHHKFMFCFSKALYAS